MNTQTSSNRLGANRIFQSNVEWTRENWKKKKKQKPNWILMLVFFAWKPKIKHFHMRKKEKEEKNNSLWIRLNYSRPSDSSLNSMKFQNNLAHSDTGCSILFYSILFNFFFFFLSSFIISSCFLENHSNSIELSKSDSETVWGIQFYSIFKFNQTEKYLIHLNYFEWVHII